MWFVDYFEIKYFDKFISFMPKIYTIDLNSSESAKNGRKTNSKIKTMS